MEIVHKARISNPIYAALLPAITLIAFATTPVKAQELVTTPLQVREQSHESPTKTGRLVIVGIDGMTFGVLDPLIKAGKVPTLARLVRDGARATLLSERPMRSPALWTTIATGQHRSVHGIYDFITGSAYWPPKQRLPKSKQKLMRSSMRSSPAIWNLASDAGLKPLVVGWLNTWPAEKINGVMVAPYVALGHSKQTSIKGKIYKTGRGQTYPRREFRRIRKLVVPPDEVSRKQVASLLDEPPARSPLYRALPRLKRWLYTARWSIASGLTNTRVVEDLLERYPDSNLIMTYFDGTDTLAHRFWNLRQPLEEVEKRLKAHRLNPKLAPELKNRFGQVIDRYYEMVDQLLARILQAAGENATVLVVSDHGWGNFPRDRALHQHVPFDGKHLMEGLLIAHGPAIEPGQFKTQTLYDIAPTALYLLGAAVPSEMPGEIAFEMIRDAYKRQNPPLLVATRDQQAPQSASDSEAESEMPAKDVELERLKSLGYVQ